MLEASLGKRGRFAQEFCALLEIPTRVSYSMLTSEDA